MKTLYSIFLIALLTFSFAAAVLGADDRDCVWSRIDDQTSEQFVSEMVTDADGNVISAGKFHNELILDGNREDQGAYMPSIYVTKFSPEGDNLWISQGESGYYSDLLDIAVDDAGNIAVVGRFRGSLQFGSFPLNNGLTEYDGFLVVLDADGAVQWARQFDSTGDDYVSATSVSFGIDGNVVVAGHYDGDMSVGSTTFPDGEGVEVFVIEFDPAGTVVRSRNLTGFDDDFASDVEMLPDGTCRLVVTHLGEIRLYPEAGFMNRGVFPNDGGNDIHIIDFAPTETSWSAWGDRTHLGGAGSVYFDDFTVDSQGNSYVACKYSGDLEIDGQAWNGYEPTTAVFKFGAGLTYEWRERIASDYGTYVCHVQSIDVQEQDDAGAIAPGLLVAGEFTTLIEPGNEKIYAAGGWDAFLLKYSRSGVYQWGEAYGDDYDQALKAVSSSPDGQIVVAGDGQGTIDFGCGPLPGTTDIKGWDIFHAKLSAEIPVELRVLVIPRYHLPVSILVIPNGTGWEWDHAYAEDGSRVDATLEVQILADDQPFIGLPAESIELVDSSGMLRSCGAFHPDASTDANGVTVFRNALLGGGVAFIDTTFQIQVDGVVVATNVIPNYRFNSPDINGDLVVNLSDISEFAGDFFGAYSYRSDFIPDGVINLSDVSVLAQAAGASCPAAAPAASQMTLATAAVTGSAGEIVGSVGMKLLDGASTDTGEPVRAAVVADRELADRLTAYDLQFELSDNLVLDDVHLAGNSLNFGEDLHYTVGVVAGTLPTDGDDIVLMTLDLHATDRQPAEIRLVDPDSGEPAVAAACALDRQKDLCSLEIRDAGETGLLAKINAAGAASSGGPALQAGLGCSPNPFNPMTHLRFAIPEAGRVSLRVYAIDGTLVKELVNESMTAGEHEATFHGTDRSGRKLASGVYFAKLTAPGVNRTTRMVLLQ